MERRPYARDGLALSLVSLGAGSPVVFQHGLGGDAAQVADIFPGDVGMRAITLECRGHGQSEAGGPEAFSIARFAGDVIAMIEAGGEAPLAVGGISMGAAIALRIAVTRPDLVSALVLARPAWLAEPAPANMRPNAFVGELLRDHPPDEAAAMFERSPTADNLADEAPDNLVALRGFFGRRPVETTRELLLRISADGPGVPREAIAGLRVPTLVIGTTRDHVHPIGLARELAATIPGAGFVEVASKSDDRQRYREELRGALAEFLGGRS